jgi:tetratricopeptide (TPR) repeat protein
LDPEYTVALDHVGGLYALQNDFNRAAYHYKQLIEIEPLVARNHNNLGVVYFRSQQYRLAIEEYSEAFRLNPNDHGARDTIADLRQRLGY